MTYLKQLFSMNAIMNGEISETKNNYEISFLAVDETDQEKVSNLLKRAGAELLFQGPFQKISLAYPIKKQKEAFFGYLHFSAEPEKIAEVEKELQNEQSLLRFLVVTPPLKTYKTERSFASPDKMPSAKPVAEPKRKLPLSNEALEKEIQEILQ